MLSTDQRREWRLPQQPRHLGQHLRGLLGGHLVLLLHVLLGHYGHHGVGQLATQGAPVLPLVDCQNLGLALTLRGNMFG